MEEFKLVLVDSRDDFVAKSATVICSRRNVWIFAAALASKGDANNRLHVIDGDGVLFASMGARTATALCPQKGMGV
jgi:hypothetical protein